MLSTNELLDEIKKLTARTKTVSCPAVPVVVTASDTAVALESGDTLGLVFSIEVPPSGEIRSATLFDMDDKGIQTDLEIFKAPIVDQATDAAFAPTKVEGLTFLCELSFGSPDDHGLFQTFDITNIGKAYSVPSGKFYIQAVTRGTPTVTAGSPYRVQLQILSDDPTWQER